MKSSHHKSDLPVKILTWNLSYGYGIGSEGSLGSRSDRTRGYIQRERSYFEESLLRIRDVIQSEKPDVVLLQEVDFFAKRSAYLDQMGTLARSTGMIYRDGLVSWDHLYVPFPGLKPRHHFGRVQSGGAILSRYPIEPVQHDLLAKPRENTWLYNSFYLSRYLQIADILIPGHRLRVMNLHLEAYSKDNRELHLVRVQDRLQDFNVKITGGDFNGDILLNPEVAAKGWSAHPAPTATFPTDHPTQILDGFILKNEIKIQSIQTLATSRLSDHFPVRLEVLVPPSI
jgi:endonuclease/exonuclease/phosphatase family metal-dependent hydrolase